MRSLLAANYLFLALLIFSSWKGQIDVLTYFGFLRLAFSKAMFFLFCACLSLPNPYSTTQMVWLQYLIAYVLIVASVLQLLKLCNKDESMDRIGENNGNLKQPISGY